MLTLNADLTPQVQTGNRCRAGTRHHHAHIGDIFLDHLEAVNQRRGGNNRRTMLVVVKDRNLHPLLELTFDIEAFRRFNVFQIHTAERGLQRGDHFDQLIGVVLSELDIKYIDPGKFLK